MSETESYLQHRHQRETDICCSVQGIVSNKGILSCFHSHGDPERQVVNPVYALSSHELDPRNRKVETIISILCWKRLEAF